MGVARRFGAISASGKKVWKMMDNFYIFCSLGFIFGTKLLYIYILDTALAFFDMSNIYFINIY